jgi:hypothetical protein
MNVTSKLIDLARSEARKIHKFNEPLGPGKGNKRSNDFTRRLRWLAETRLQSAIQAEHPTISGANYRFDYFIPSEKTVIEIALSLHNANTEFEKDIMKVLLAKYHGLDIRRLVFLGKTGSESRMQEAGPAALKAYAKSKYKLIIDVIEIS